ncbi:MAG: haloacid dehalogenase type II [Verrucomicrobiota bacterium]
MKRLLKLATLLIMSGTLAVASPRIIVFDVNETLLDINALIPQFVRIFGDANVAQEWFSNVVLYSQVTTLTGPYIDFGSVARASLKMTAAAHGRPLTQEDEDEVIKGLVSLPVHPDVREGLEKLRAAGFRMVTLTNSAPAAVEKQLKSAGISGYFERNFSVDAVRKFKPAPEVYQQIATELGVDGSQLRLVAAHAWDIVGAQRAGWAAAFIARPGKALYPLGGRSDVVGPDLRDVADQIIKLDTPVSSPVSR